MPGPAELFALTCPAGLRLHDFHAETRQKGDRWRQGKAVDGEVSWNLRENMALI